MTLLVVQRPLHTWLIPIMEAPNCMPFVPRRLTMPAQVLDEQREVLLLKGCIDMDTLKGSTWPLHYVARPAGNGCMLVRR